MRKITAFVVVALVATLTACSSSALPKSKPTVVASKAPNTYSTAESIDQKFLASLGSSAYGALYRSRSQQDLTQAARDFCQQMTSPPNNGLNEINSYSGGNLKAVTFYGHLAAKTYCPEVPSSEVANLVG